VYFRERPCTYGSRLQNRRVQVRFLSHLPHIQAFSTNMTVLFSGLDVAMSVAVGDKMGLREALGKVRPGDRIMYHMSICTFIFSSNRQTRGRCN
jgi:hypothetical protein